MRAALVIFFVVLAFAPASYSQPVRDYTFHVDVVELIDRNAKVDGKPELAIERGKHTYLFSNETNKSAFEKSPEKYEVQFGGACARMGPLSGDGTTKLFAVHDHRLYVFASESCRIAFEAEPEKFIDRDDLALQTTEDSRKRGRDMLGRAVDALSCVAGVDNLTTYRESLARDEKSGGKAYRVTTSLTLAFPDKFRTDECWDDSCFGNMFDGRDAWSIGSSGTERMHPQQLTALRLVAMHPLTILRARDANDILISATGERRTIQIPGEGEVAIDLVAVHRHGITTTLGLDNAHRIRLMSTRGRGPRLTLGRIDRLYRKFHDVGGMKLPGHVDVLFDDQPVPTQSGDFVQQIINDPKDAERFVAALPDAE